MNADIKRKHILFDSCVVGEIFKGPAGLFNDIIQAFIDNDCKFCINDFIRFEFLRIAYKEEEYKKLDAFLSKQFTILPITADIYQMTSNIACIYNLCSKENKHKISLVDCLNAAFVYKYSKDLLLITLDNNDYPIDVFNRTDVGAIDSGKKILTWGLYAFNQKKYLAKEEIFKK